MYLVKIFTRIYVFSTFAFHPPHYTLRPLFISQVMIAEALDIERETYLAIVMDRENNGPVIVGSPFGGMDIEKVAETNPDAIYKVCVCVCV